jgi:hypothetical protein
LIPRGYTWQQKKKLIKDAREYWWDDPYLYKEGIDGLMRRCVARDEARSIMWHCHSSNYGGHHDAARTVAKIPQCGLWWLTMNKDCERFVRHCDRYPRTGNISKRNEMPQKGMLEIEPFDCWGIDFMERFPVSDNKLYILVCVDYVTKWVEAFACHSNDALFAKEFFLQVWKPSDTNQ